MARWRLQFVKYWVFAKNSIFWVPISLQPDFSNIDFNLIEFIVWNYTTSGCKGKWSLWQKIMIFFRFRKVICWSIDCLIDWFGTFLRSSDMSFWLYSLSYFTATLGVSSHQNILQFHFQPFVKLETIREFGVKPSLILTEWNRYNQDHIFYSYRDLSTFSLFLMSLKCSLYILYYRID